MTAAAIAAAADKAGAIRAGGRAVGRTSPKGVHEFECMWASDSDGSPSTSPRTGAEILEAAKAQGKVKYGAPAQAVDSEGSLDLPSEEEFESHLFGVQLSFM